jgi:hypothetical protein
MKYILGLAWVLILFSCDTDRRDIPDVSKIAIQPQVIRLDKEIAAIKTLDHAKAFVTKHSHFAEIFTREVLYSNSNNTDSMAIAMHTFATDTSVIRLLAQVAKRFPDDKKLLDDITDVQKRLRYYFPKSTSDPVFYTFVSEYGYQVFEFIDDQDKESIALGLDMFLRPEVDYKKINPENNNFSDYITRSWTPDLLTKRVAEVQIQAIAGDPPGFRLLDMMIHNGKQLYMISHLIPVAHDSIVHEYSSKQMQWCEDNEHGLWAFFLDRKMFYETTPAKISKYLTPAPFSPDMPAEAPGRTANYIGYKIVKAYMDRHPETTMDALLQIRDSQKLMEQSRYKPKTK